MQAECTHLNRIKATDPDKWFCEESINTGSSWVNLRMCLTCGHIACCDSSPNRHATKHFEVSIHGKNEHSRTLLHCCA
jgi:hypothetical protein